MNSMLEMELRKAAALTFEELGFIFPMPELEEERRDAEFDAAAVVDFQGPFKGRLVVTARGELLPNLTANMLGEDEPPTEQQQLDALGEIANVVCGNLLPNIAGTKHLFHVSAPQLTRESGEAERAIADPSVEVVMPLSDGRADFRLFLG